MVEAELLTMARELLRLEREEHDDAGVMAELGCRIARAIVAEDEEYQKSVAALESWADEAEAEAAAIEAEAEAEGLPPLSDDPEADSADYYKTEHAKALDRLRQVERVANLSNCEASGCTAAEHILARRVIKAARGEL